jgi:hypothetical protein
MEANTAKGIEWPPALFKRPPRKESSCGHSLEFISDLKCRQQC